MKISRKWRRSWRRKIAAAMTATLLSAVPVAMAMPQGGDVAAGAASISRNGQTMTIDQTTNKAIIQWQSFNIASGERVRFNQPGSGTHTIARAEARPGARTRSNTNTNTIADTRSGTCAGTRAGAEPVSLAVGPSHLRV